MQSTSYNVFYVGSAVVQALIAVGTLIVVTVGWKRERHYGYVLLMAWAIISFSLSFSGVLQTMLIHQFAPQRTVAGVPWTILYSFAIILGRILSSGLLLGGLWMLVFRKSISQNSGREPN